MAINLILLHDIQIKSPSSVISTNNIQIIEDNNQGNGKTCSSSLNMCWVINVRIAPVHDASSLRRPSLFCTSSCSRANRWAKRSFSLLCSREYVPATFLTRLSSAGKITWNYQRKILYLQCSLQIYIVNRGILKVVLEIFTNISVHTWLLPDLRVVAGMKLQWM